MTREDFFALSLSGEKWDYETAMWVANESGWCEPLAKTVEGGAVENQERFKVIEPFMFGFYQTEVGDMLMVAPREGTTVDAMILTRTWDIISQDDE